MQILWCSIFTGYAQPNYFDGLPTAQYTGNPQSPPSSPYPLSVAEEDLTWKIIQMIQLETSFFFATSYSLYIV
ncbi:hypothetical protein BDZ94DRAFT_1267690 [Collybia nuda]|uniref:Uncharacterized protein n=1 Tax=Collybia nuda TaxID=64659 RepID=A0A9P5XXN5_9AGAR|nr:hypothetical protein BDZ94DRAFT_1267690 [Collybia nuda]